jgi:CRP-like cAMP-binding protein
VRQNGSSPRRRSVLATRVHADQRTPLHNALLRRLASEDRQRLVELCRRVELGKGHSLYAVGDRMPTAWFPLSGLTSLLTLTGEGLSIETAVVGADGLLGLNAIATTRVAGCHAVVQLPMVALQVSTDRLRAEFDHSPAIRRLMLDYSTTLLDQTMRAVACHRFHTVTQRMARWLLTAQDHLDTDLVRLTQEQLAALLGTQRTAVTHAATTLQALGVIRQRHGRTYILQRTRLIEAACECYVAPTL